MSLRRRAARLNERYFGNAVHTYTTLEDIVRRHLGPDKTLRDAGCGHGAPLHVDVTDFDRPIDGIARLNRALKDTGLPAGSIDVIMSRSVMGTLPIRSPCM